jgi:septal ring factor EnvC (AmiA/AmiB activator)
VDGGEAAPAESHFFVAVCARGPQTGNPAFVYIPSAANVLRERETHIALLEGELRQKNDWLETAKQELAALDRAHRSLTAELEESNRWAGSLNAQLAASGARIHHLQEELAQEQAKATAAIAELERENRAKTEWAGRTASELEAKVQELAQCVEYLHQAERTVEERTRWAQAVQAEVDQFRASRWVRLGRRFGLGPEAQ